MNILSSVWKVWLIKLSLLVDLVYGGRGTFSENTDEEFQMLVSGGYIPDNNKFVRSLVSIRTLKCIQYHGDNHFCAGIIISSLTVLTAAHCITDQHNAIMNPHGILVVFGAGYRLADVGKDDARRVNRVVIHPHFRRYVNYDVAVLRLTERMPSNGRHVRAINKRKSIKLHEGMRCVTLGWGQLYPHGPYANEIMFLDVFVRAADFCKDMENFDAEGTICVEPDSEGKVCPGDMGGPLVCQDYLAGIIGGGEKSCEGVKAMKFVNFTEIEKWIDKTVEAMSCCNSNELLSTLLFLLLALTVVLEQCW